ncbi:MAG: HipA domain-containing protein [Lachnospiraceae bacterium]|nr:HipA domain-containing protein [Lachnospiraceae bacterium]
MSIEERLYAELNILPKGYISGKKIHGREYYYLQHEENGRTVSEYIKISELDNVRLALKRRKEIEEILVKNNSGTRYMPKPTKRSRELTGSLMMEDTEVARFEKGICISRNDALCPLFIKRTGNITDYLASRAIDRNRTNSRILKKILRINETEDSMTALHSYGATITDNYWFRTSGSKLKYSDISFTKDYYSEIALKGEILYYPKHPRYTPQLTLTGSYEKCWRRIEDKWWLYKKGSDREIFSEIFCAELAHIMKIPTVRYEYDEGFIRTKNFAEKYNFEPMTSVAGEDDNYEKVFQELNKISRGIAKQYLKLVLFDLIVNNVDRHNENCGLLRDKKNGRIISLAPNFDNNLALISRCETLNMKPAEDGLIKCFMKFLKSNTLAAAYCKEIKFPDITADKIEKILDKNPLSFPQYDIKQYIVKRYKYVLSAVL